MLAAPEAQLRISALKACGEWKSSPAHDLVKAAVADINPNVRCQALRTLAATDPQASAGELIRSLGDGSRFVARTASSLIHLAGPSALDPLLESLDQPPLEQGVLRALRPFPYEHLRARREALTAFALRKVENTRRYQDMLLELRILFPGGAPHLAEALRDRMFKNAVAALNAAGLLSDPESAPAAIEDLQSRDADQRANALEMLDGLKEKAIIRAILPLFEGSVAETVEATRPTEADCTEFWLTALQEPDPWVRACAVHSLPRPPDPRIRTVLVRLTADVDAMVRETAIGILKGGPEVKTLPTLSTLERIFFLKKVPLFAGFELPELQQVVKICREEWFADGETIALQGEIGEEMFIIAGGWVRILDERSRELARRGEGEVVGEMAVISREPRMATMVASGEVRALIITQAEFEQILGECPEASLAVMRVLCDRLRESQASVQR
jgi:HEAT repeat protein